MPARPITLGDEAASNIDQRSSNRLTFRQNQRIAPYSGGPIPPDNAFVAVPFSDISQGGFSYLIDRAPDHELLVVAMQVHDQVVPMQARILHYRLQGQQYVVGCQFTGRLPNSEDNPIPTI